MVAEITQKNKRFSYILYLKFAANATRKYIYMSTLFDIVICVGPMDEAVVHRCVGFNRQNIQGYRNVYLIAKNPQLQVQGAVTIDEATFPFSIADVRRLHQPSAQHRNGWYLQQLLKLYAGFCIPGILPRYLVVDCDTQFVRPTQFIDYNQGKNHSILSLGQQHHKPYFEHMQRLHPDLKRQHPDMSGIIHHMMFETKFVEELMRMVENQHNEAAPFWQLFLEQVATTDQSLSGASEYEIYFNFMLHFHRSDIQIRQLRYLECRRNFYVPPNVDMVSDHWYFRSAKNTSN
jgi:hypothetical protein